jgi:hypothetical protein
MTEIELAKMLTQFMLVFFLAIFAHEMGHIAFIRFLKAKWQYKFPFTILFDKSKMSKDDIRGVYEVGIYFGAIVILFATILLSFWHYITLFIYAICCRYDYNKWKEV